MKGKYDEHYKNLNPQPIEVIENWGLDFHLANVLKYISRAGKKEGESELKDLEKAKVYLERKILKLREEDEYKVGQVWTDPDYPKYTMTIKEVYLNNQILVELNNGHASELVHFNKTGEIDEDGYFEFRLTVLKKDV